VYVPAGVVAGTWRRIGSADLDSLLTVRVPAAGSTAMLERDSDIALQLMCWETLDMLWTPSEMFTLDPGSTTLSPLLLDTYPSAGSNPSVLDGGASLAAAPHVVLGQVASVQSNVPPLVKTLELR
jgi:hypothetical protein